MVTLRIRTKPSRLVQVANLNYNPARAVQLVPGSIVIRQNYCKFFDEV